MSLDEQALRSCDLFFDQMMHESKFRGHNVDPKISFDELSNFLKGAGSLGPSPLEYHALVHDQPCIEAIVNGIPLLVYLPMADDYTTVCSSVVQQLQLAKHFSLKTNKHFVRVLTTKLKLQATLLFQIKIGSMEV